jgi:hypothetical protein
MGDLERACKRSQGADVGNGDKQLSFAQKTMYTHFPVAPANLIGRCQIGYLTGIQPKQHQPKRRRRSMRGFKQPGFTDRQKAAQQARQNLLEKFRSKPGPDDPEVVKRRQEREAIAARREQVRLEREAAKAEEKRRHQEAAAAESARLAREAEEAAAQQAALEAEQKAKRDARYAARKARGKKR